MYVQPIEEDVRVDELCQRRGSVATRDGRKCRVPGTLPFASADDGEPFRERRQQLDAVLAHDREVLDPDAAEARKVDAGLDRDHVADLEHVARLGRESRRLVDRETDAVTEAVAEARLVAPLL